MQRILMGVIALLAAAFIARACTTMANAQPATASYIPTGYQQLASATVTITIASPAVFTIANNGYIAGQIVQFSNSGGNLPTGLTAGTNYFVVPITTSTFSVSATPGGALVNTSATQAGVQSSQPVSLGVPTGGARMAVMCAETQNIRWRDDGVTPTATVGMLLVTGGIYACQLYSGQLSAFQFIPAAAGGILDVSYYR